MAYGQMSFSSFCLPSRTIGFYRGFLSSAVGGACPPLVKLHWFGSYCLYIYT